MPSTYQELTAETGFSPFPASAYIHIPFCRHRCGYCNFSLVARRDYLIQRYLAALQTEIDWLPAGVSIPLRTLYLGGGTPSHLSPVELRQLREIVDRRFQLDREAEVTAECNPNDLDESRVEAFRQWGVNRVSLGVQSLSGPKLRRLDRDHSPEQAAESLKYARQFANSVSLDLIFAAPGETLEQWETDLRMAVQLQPDHISTYELTFEKGTEFWNRLQRGELSQSEEELRAEMYELALEILQQAGYQQYEISSFARHGHQSRHNQIYWIGDPYLAFGPGAARFVGGCRQTNHPSPLQYMRWVENQQSPVWLSEKLSPADAARELLAIGLRRVVGVRQADFAVRTGYTTEALIGDKGLLWQEKQIVEQVDGWFRLTRQGRLVYDRVASEILTATRP
jgi:oxygen-independent coproporphyrinogen-3 oxidase